jgi:hypothetical protein
MTAQDDINYYLNFVVYAVFGQMAPADQMMRQHGRNILRFASYLRREVGFSEEIECLYRGVAVNPRHVIDDTLPADPNLTFVSMSEDSEVACWFGHPHSSVSQFIFMQDPNRKGYMIEYEPDGDEILFHHEWADELNLIHLAALHPHIDENQFEWNLRTQQEVIILPVDSFDVVSIDDYDCPDVSELDRKFTAPWVSSLF